MVDKIEIRIFKDSKGREPFNDWLSTLDKTTKSRIFARLNRIIGTNFGDYKNLGSGIFELRFDFGSGYRVYFGKDGKKIIFLLCGGDKKTQKQDIEKAKQYWEDYEKQKG